MPKTDEFMTIKDAAIFLDVVPNTLRNWGAAGKIPERRNLTDNNVLYHYPTTKRPASRDENEINATKNAARLGLPLFVISYPSPSSQFRDVRLAWIDSWDDKMKQFLIVFGDEPPIPKSFDDSTPFELTSKNPRKRSTVMSRTGQQEFKFRVFRHYGARCAFCDITVPETLDAAHLCPKSEDGSDDPRNGLVLCATHHRAFDAGHIGIHPQQLTIETSTHGATAAELHITNTDLSDLPNLPHRDALDWCWSSFTKDNNG